VKIRARSFCASPILTPPLLSLENPLNPSESHTCLYSRLHPLSFDIHPQNTREWGMLGSPCINLSTLNFKLLNRLLPLSPLFPLHTRMAPVTPLFPLHTQKQGGRGSYLLSYVSKNFGAPTFSLISLNSLGVLRTGRALATIQSLHRTLLRGSVQGTSRRAHCLSYAKIPLLAVG